MKSFILAAAFFISPTAFGNSPFVESSKVFFQELVAISVESKKSTQEGTSPQVRQVSEKIDFLKLAQKSLGSRWAQQKKHERDEFLRVLQELLELVVFPQARKISVAEDTVRYEPLKGKKNHIQIVSDIEREKRGEKIKQKIEVILIFDSKTLKIVDAVIEGEELSANLNRQFTEALKKQSFATIIEKMRKRVEELKGAAK